MRLLGHRQGEAGSQMEGRIVGNYTSGTTMRAGNEGNNYAQKRQGGGAITTPPLPSLPSGDLARYSAAP